MGRLLELLQIKANESYLRADAEIQCAQRTEALLDRAHSVRGQQAFDDLVGKLERQGKEARGCQN